MKAWFLSAAIVVVIASACARQPAPAAAASAAGPQRATPSPSCPAKDFAGFLRAFASDDRVRVEYTAPLVKVTEWVDASVVDPVEATNSVPKAEYKGFTLKFIDGAFRHLDADGKPYGAPVNVAVAPQGSNYEVRYVIGMSEGNSWLFSRRGDCWQLTADPEATWE